MRFEIVSPTSILDLLSTIDKYQDEPFRFGAGGTDLLMELKKKPQDDLTVINLAQILDNHFTNITKNDNYYCLGAMVTAHKMVMNDDIRNNYPVLYEAAHTLASTQIRQVATVGGNLCTASPSGDIACALVALNSQCEILSSTGSKRMVPITGFFTGPRGTVLKTNEVLYNILIPINSDKNKIIISNFIKIGTRRSMECSVVSLAYHLQTDETGEIISAGVAIGASAPTIRFTTEACNFIVGKKINEISEEEKAEFARLVLTYAAPITDIRASAWYRKEVLYNISKNIFE